MNIVFASSEAVPFCKTGGLADVVSALAAELSKAKHRVSVFLPFYLDMKSKFPEIKSLGKHLSVPMPYINEDVEIYFKKVNANLTFYFFSTPLFNRPGVYGDHPASSYFDNDRRFALFSRAVLEASKSLKLNPQIIHGHDWPTGLIPAYKKYFYSSDPYFKNTATVFTIHNMGYQGNFSAEGFLQTGLPSQAFQPGEIEFYGSVSYLKSGLIFSDALNTVSPTYAKEVMQDPVHGSGMEGVLRSRMDRFRGVLNGLDTDYWNPARDTFIDYHFDAQKMSGKSKCKKELQRITGLPTHSDIPLIGFIGRMDYQKGVDLIIEVAPLILKDGVQMVFLGQGQPNYIQSLRQLAFQFPSQVYVGMDFSEPLAHAIYAGSDIFLMPSRYEPCGLGQMISMRYGGIPVVTPTGGLLDSVEPLNAKKGTGFVASEFSAGAYLAEIHRAINVYKNAKLWKAAQKRAMKKDFSWDQSVQKYEDMYEEAIGWNKSSVLAAR